MENLLGDYRVLDMTDEKGFLCGKILGDLGADVVKIEPPGGDQARKLGPFFYDDPHPEKSLYWFSGNTSKHGITLNIETKGGQDIFKRLVSIADFVVESFPPGYLDSLGLGYQALSEINPRIIVTSVTPFGQTGPYKDYKMDDLTAMAMGGLMFICGDRDRPPVRVTVPQAYFHAGTSAAMGTLTAHYYRQITGEGQQVDVSIEECVVWATYLPLPYWDLAKILSVRSGSKQVRLQTRFSWIFPCKDGYVCYRVGTGATLGPMQARAVELMESKGMAGDLKDVDWLATSLDGVSQKDIDHWEECMTQYFLKHTKNELHQQALKHDFMLFPVYTTKDAMEYEQLKARDFWVELEHSHLDSTITYPAAMFKSSEVSCRTRIRPPLIGEHNEEIYHKELGISQQELALLKETSAI